MTREEATNQIILEKDYIEDIPGSDNTVKALEMAIEALKENPFKVVYDFFREYVFPCNDDLVDSSNDYYTGIFDLMARIKEKADEIDASALGGNNIYEK